MTTKNIQDVVAEIAERVAKQMDGRTVTSHEHYRSLLKKELEHELTQLVKEVENEIVTSTYLQAVNETLETQALVLEGMRQDEVYHHGYDWTEGHNQALQQAADYLQAQKITE